MAIFQVVYRDDEHEELITIGEISSRSDVLTVKENIYCSTLNCDCKLSYVPRGVKSAYFKKHVGHNHIDSCQHFIFTDENGRPRRVVGADYARLSSKRKRDMLKGIYKTHKETEEERQMRLDRQRAASRNKRNRVVQSGNQVVDVTVQNPTTSNNAEQLVEDGRSMPVRRRHSILDVADSDIGNNIVVIGTVIEIVNSENYGVITLKDSTDTMEFKLYLERVFYENSPINTPQMLTSIESFMEDEVEVTVSSVGEVVNRDNRKGMLVLAEEDLSFNGERLGSFIMNN
ncbi:hypothetical protein FC678_23695 [Peribacillus simplex]|uniref:Uncharacterized protein n=1 Tax=Peribacillus simplex TaxID=1478 RepID=A0A9X8ZD03_9BACI|nr:hypothetical protein [Peribacillus simplex]TKH06153.1 hypothetical protein FC678_23695 [Peribacillus simplex]